MGSSHDSRYWVCRSCFREFDWRDKTSNPADHDEAECRQRKTAERKERKK